jgi:thiamine biosynthesis protein ThiS
MRTKNTIQVILNGETREITAGLSVADLLHELGLHPRTVVVEHNREILRREHLSGARVQGGDTLEVVHFVGGG